MITLYCIVCCLGSAVALGALFGTTAANSILFLELIFEPVEYIILSTCAHTYQATCFSGLQIVVCDLGNLRSLGCVRRQELCGTVFKMRKLLKTTDPDIHDGCICYVSMVRMRMGSNSVFVKQNTGVNSLLQ